MTVTLNSGADFQFLNLGFCLFCRPEETPFEAGNDDF